jgi:hypothetical protein
MPTHLTSIRRLTVYAAVGLADDLINQFQKLGAKGYTCVEAKGRGDHGTVEDLWAHSSHIRIELLVQPQVADKIVDYLASPAMRAQSIAFTSEDVNVFNPEHF